MKYEIKYGPAYALGIIQLASGEKIQAEAGAMVSMSDTVKMSTSVRAGCSRGSSERC